jgi:uncharacterized protein (TIGR02266 family)
MSDSTRTRSSPRLPVVLPVTYQNEGELARDVVTNIGEGGLFIRTSRPLPIGTTIEMAIAVGEGVPPIVQRGKVTWARGLPGDGMGVRFEPPVDPRIADILKAKKVNENA